VSKFVRAWWPELLIGGCLGLFALWGAAEAVGAYMAASHLAMTKDADVVLASGYTLAILALGWGLCARHRRLPLEERFDRKGD